MVTDAGFSKSQSLHESLNFIIGHKRSVFLEGTGSLCRFQENVCQV